MNPYGILLDIERQAHHFLKRFNYTERNLVIIISYEAFDAVRADGTAHSFMHHHEDGRIFTQGIRTLRSADLRPDQVKVGFLP